MKIVGKITDKVLMPGFFDITKITTWYDPEKDSSMISIYFDAPSYMTCFNRQSVRLQEIQRVFHNRMIDFVLKGL